MTEAEAKGLHSSQPISYYTGMIVCLISTPDSYSGNKSGINLLHLARC